MIDAAPPVYQRRFPPPWSVGETAPQPLLREPVQQVEAYRTRKEHGQNMDQG